MDVHQHSHAPGKKWTHYFWEFLMLFLAVFCGFLAENQREHMVERQRAKQYAKSLLADLRLDTVELGQGLIQTKFIISSMDSLLATTVIPATTDLMPGAFETAISGNNEIDVVYRDKIMGICSHILKNHYFSLFAATRAEDNTHPLSGKIDSLMTIQLPIQQGSSKLIDELLNQITVRRWKLTTLVYFYKKAIDDAKEIIVILMRLYHLK